MFEDLDFEDIANVETTQETVEEIKTGLEELQEKLGFEFEKPEDIPVKVLEKFLSNLSDDAKEVAEILFRGGNVSKDEIKEFLNKGDAKETYDNEADARVYLKTKLVDVVGEDDIDDYLDNLEDKGKLLDKANTLREKEIKDEKENYVKQLESKNKQEQERMTQYITNLNREFEKVSWSEQLKDKVVEIANPEKVNNILTQISNNPKIYLEFLGILSTYSEEGFKLDSYLEAFDTKKVNNIKSKLEKIQDVKQDGKLPSKFDVSEYEIVM